MRLKAAACDAVMRYGTHFSSSRAYLSAPLYRECEQRLSEMTGGYPVVLAQTTSLAHLSVLPMLIDDDDAVLYDLDVHSSVHAVLPALRAAWHPLPQRRSRRAWPSGTSGAGAGGPPQARLLPV